MTCQTRASLANMADAVSGNDSELVPKIIFMEEEEEDSCK